MSPGLPKNPGLPKKAICKWDRDTLEESLPLLVTQVLDAKFLCRKCGRAAAQKKLLCKAVRIDSLNVPEHPREV